MEVKVQHMEENFSKKIVTLQNNQTETLERDVKLNKKSQQIPSIART